MSDKTVKLKMIAQPSMSRAIHDYCFQCGGNQSVAVRDCNIPGCPLWPYRFGANPQAAKNRLSKHYRIQLI